MSTSVAQRSKTVKILQIAAAILFCLLTAGIIFGFAALKNVLIREGVYEGLCDSEEDRQRSHRTGRACVGQDLQLNLAFTISVVVNNVAALPIGIILDHIGPKRTSLIGSVLFGLGCIVMGFDQQQPNFDPFLISFILLAIGGPMIFLSSFHLSNAFPRHSGLILSAITGAFDASSLPFVIYSSIYRNHTVSLRKFFWIYAIIPAFILVEQLFLAPSIAYSRASDELAEATEETPLLADESADPSDSQITPAFLGEQRLSFYDSSFFRIHGSIDAYNKGKASAPGGIISGAEDDLTGSLAKEGNQDPITGILWDKPALSQICTLWFWLPQLFLTCHMLRINYEIATIYDQVYYYTNDLELAEKLTNAFVLLLPLSGIVSIPFIGYLLDRRSSMTAFVVLLVIGLGYGTLCMTTSVPAQLVGITLFTIMRPLMYTAISDYYTKIVGIETFGTVYGFANAFSGLFTLVQYPIDFTVKKKLKGNYTPINAALLVLGVVLAVAVIAKQYYGTKDRRASVRI